MNVFVPTAAVKKEAPAVDPRFADNTTQKPVNRRRVYGYGAGTYMQMPCSGSNQPQELIAQGELILFLPHVFRQDIIGFPDEGYSFEQPAQSFANAVAGRFQFGPNGDLGYRTLDMLTALDYDTGTGWDEADIYFDTVHPSFEEVGIECEMGLDVCPTCRLKWLSSPECRVRIDASGLDGTVLERLHQELKSANQAAKVFAQSKLTATDADIAQARSGKPGKAGYDEIDFQYAKMLHKKDAVTEQAELVTKQAKIQGDALAENLARILADKSKDTEIDALKAKIAQLEAAQEEPKKRGNPNWVKKDK